VSYEFDNHAPIYLQLIELFNQKIVNGSWTAGDRVASVRELALEFGVNPNTVQRALAEMEREGMMYTERTSGRFITQDQQLISDTRQQLAEEKIDQFINQMQGLGLGRDELKQLIDRKWGKNNGADRNQ
jgi:DNA-binding transcriptional regulator YhcF (GntR family)